MVKNQQSYADLHVQSNDDESSNGSEIDKDDGKNDNINVEMEDEVEDRNKEVELEKQDKYFTLETTFERSEGTSDEEYAEGLILMSIKLL